MEKDPYVELERFRITSDRGSKKVVISSFPDFKGKVQVTAIDQQF
jgi:hypothetical protein